MNIVVDMKAILNNSLLKAYYKTLSHIDFLGIHELISQKQIFIMTFHMCLKAKTLKLYIQFLSFKDKNALYIHAVLIILLVYRQFMIISPL